MMYIPLPGLGRLGAPASLLFTLLVFTGASCKDIIGGREGPGDVQMIWRTSIATGGSGPHSTPATDGERLFAEVGRTIQAFDVRSGALIWSVPRPPNSPANVVVRDGRVFAAGSSILALDAASGRELWQFKPDTTATFGRITVDDYAVYIGTASHRVYALSTTDGTALWSVDIGPEWNYPSVVRGISVSGDTLYIGAEQWRAQNGYIASGWLVALNRYTGAVLWRYSIGSGNERRNVASQPTVAGRLLLASDHFGSSFFAVDRFTGEEVWRVNGDLGFFGPVDPPRVVGDVAYAGSSDTFVYAVALDTGRELWKTRVPASIRAYATCGDRVFANYQGVAVLDRRTGKLLNTMYDRNEEFTTSGFAVHDGRVFVLGTKAVYAFSCK